jgi:orotate phosphoribosyltransferase
MIFDKNIAKKTAELLLQIKAIKLNPDNPFTWASGWSSPIYCDNRITLSYVAIRNYLRQNLAKIVEEKYGKPDVIAGVATGAIAIGVLIAEELGIPFVYVRPEPKKHGRQNQIEGYIEKGQNVVIIEDLISTGKSSLNAVKALNEQDVKVKGNLSLVEPNTNLLLGIFSCNFNLISGIPFKANKKESSCTSNLSVFSGINFSKFLRSDKKSNNSTSDFWLVIFVLSKFIP